MTQEDIKLLLKDLCARLPYGVFIHYHWSREGNTIDEDRELDFSDVETLKYNIENPQNDWCEISWKPYLRPLSSMTEEEKEEIRQRFCYEWEESEVELMYCSIEIGDADCLIDWLLEHHLDFRGLIEKGLAEKALDWMYKID